MLFQLLFCLSISRIVETSLVKFENNAYNGVVVAISESIKQDKEDDLVKAIEDMFTKGSRFLYEATGKRAYFGSVTILLPKTWKKKDGHFNAGTESYETADVRVGLPSGPLNMSYTLRGCECYKKGKFIHVNEGHLLMTDPKQALNLYGKNPGSWLTKHWAMYRYGVYEEHGIIGNDRFRTFYERDGRNSLTSCHYKEGNIDQTVYGHSYDWKTGAGCTTSGSDPVNSKFCYYATLHDDIYSSITFDHANDNVKYFCGYNASFPHNPFPPTRQNELCGNQSTWEVIMKHADFRNNANPPRNITNTKPTFRKVIHNTERFVLAIDTSTSMGNPIPNSEKTHLQMINTAIERAVMNNLPFGSTLGIVAFNKKAVIVQPMMTITTQSDKQFVIRNLPKNGSGSTCIACGLRKAIEVIKNYNSSVIAGSKIIVISDGNENEVERIENVTSLLQEHSVRVFPIAYGNYADEGLEQLAKNTNGIVCFIPSLAEPSEPFTKFLSQIFSSSGPSGMEVTYAKKDENNLSEAAGMAFHIGQNRLDLQVVKVEGWINVNGEEIDARDQRVAIYAFVHKIDRPVTDAVVYAEILTPNGNGSKILLNDNGLQPDMTANDGVYSRYLLEFNGNGRYGVRLVINAVGQREIIVANKWIFRSSPITEEKIITIGSFKVKDNFNSVSKDVYPPNAIEDLKVVEFCNKTYKVTFNWTAPGDDFDIGNASRYLIKYDYNFLTLKNSFEKVTTEITKNNLTSGSLTPSSAGSKEKISFQISSAFFEKYNSFYIAIVAADDNNNYGKISNIAVASPKPLPPYVTREICNQIGAKFPYPPDCRMYLLCEYEHQPPVVMKCAIGTKYNDTIKSCDWLLNGEGC